MIQVTGTDGDAAYAYRPWTHAVMKQSLHPLPPITVAGEAFSNALKVYCDQFAPTWMELNKLLAIHLSPADRYHISTQLQGEGQLRRPGGMNLPENAQDMILFTAFEVRLKEAFSKRVNTQGSCCKQDQTESVADFYVRMLKVNTVVLNDPG